ncbi:nuclease domain-containing protein [Photobacterium toruni]|uniref:nuclease domain-containing protein n=1 Tax=Photobacterium toruni TaxID=1935446 RepID=UPI002E17A9A2|nr:nuclease domain-containing protein [Photobacterium toruni]
MNCNIIVKDYGGYCHYNLTSGINIVLHETDNIKFEILLDHEAKVSLYINDIPETLYSKILKDNEITYQTPEYKRFFYNYFGECNLKIIIDDDEFNYKVDIEARDENIEMTKGILEYLNQEYESILMSCFSRTGDELFSEKNGSSNLQLIIKKVGFVSEYIFNNINLLIKKKKTELTTSIEWSTMDGYLSPNSIYLIQNNLHYSSTSSKENSNFKYNGKYFKLLPFPKEEHSETTDVYENQLLHGFIKHINSLLLKIKNIYEEELNIIKKRHYQNQVVKFDNIINSYNIPILDYQIERIIIIQNKIGLIKKIFDKHIPVSNEFIKMPKITTFIKSNIIYRRVFELIIDLYSYNDIEFEIDQPNILFGIRNLSTLYEYYILIKIIDTLKNNFNFVEVERKAIDTNHINNYYKFEIFDQLEVELYYEPIIRKSNNKNDIDLFKVSTDGLFRKPDFVLKIKNLKTNKFEFIIFDAKYSDYKIVKSESVPDLVYKYLLGFRFYDESESLRMASICYAIYPHDKDDKERFKFDYYNNNSVFPWVGAIKVDLSQRNEIATIIREYLYAKNFLLD